MRKFHLQVKALVLFPALPPPHVSHTFVFKYPYPLVCLSEQDPMQDSLLQDQASECEISSGKSTAAHRHLTPQLFTTFLFKKKKKQMHRTTEKMWSILDT